MLVGSYDGHLYALEKATGAVRWRVEGVGHATSEAVPHRGNVYYAERGRFSNYWTDEETVLEEQGRVYGIRPA